MMVTISCPDWLPLLKQPYEERLGARSIWDLHTANSLSVRIERRDQGMNNSIFRVEVGGEAFACKLFVADERRRAWREWTALDRLWRAGLRFAPEPVAYLPDGPLPQPAVIYRWAEAASLATQIVCAQDLIDLVSALGTIHRAPNLPNVETVTAFHQPPDSAAYLAEIRENADRVHAWARQRRMRRDPSARMGRRSAAVGARHRRVGATRGRVDRAHSIERRIPDLRAHPSGRQPGQHLVRRE